MPVYEGLQPGHLARSANRSPPVSPDKKTEDPTLEIMMGQTPAVMFTPGPTKEGNRGQKPSNHADGYPNQTGLSKVADVEEGSDDQNEGYAVVFKGSLRFQWVG